MLIYVIIIGVATGFAFLSQVGETIMVENTKEQADSLSIRKTQALEGMRKVFFALSFLVLWFFSAFATNGTDRISYAMIFWRTGLESLKEGFLEPGFQIFNLMVRFWSSDVQVLYITITTVTLGLLYATFYYLRKEIKIGYAVLAYGCLFYVQSLSLMRMYLAAAILFWGVRFLKQQQYIKYVLVILLTSLIHYSVLLVLLPMLIIYFLHHKKYEIKVNIFLIIILCMGGFMLLRMGESLLAQIPMFTRFQHYFIDISFAQIGMAQFAYFLPLCMFLFMIWYTLDENYKRIFFAFLLTSFLVAIMSYLVHILGRALALFPLVYLWMIPYGIRRLGERNASKLLYYGVQLGVIFYYIFRFYIYIYEYQILDQVVPYTNKFF